MLTIARQSVLSALVAWGMCMNMQMKLWDLSAGSVVVLAGMLGGRAMLATNTGLAGMIVFNKVSEAVNSLAEAVAGVAKL